MGKELHVGDKAPELGIPDQDGKRVSLKDLKGKQVVLYFYPKDDTPGCTKESCDFRDSISSIQKAGAVVVGVSLDGQASHQKFIKKFSLPFPLLSDEDKTVSTAYGVYKEKSMYGKKYWGIERSTFIIGKDGTLKNIFRKVKVDGHVDEVRSQLLACACHAAHEWSPLQGPAGADSRHAARRRRKSVRRQGHRDIARQG
jgi:thioredoxin-dependent peroxiredoxin